jgi:general secretion pathway protein B
MSILLEALRKSEKKQRLHEAPTIHTDDQNDPVAEPLPTGLLVTLLIAGLFVSGWFVWHQYQPPAGSYQPPITLAADKVLSVSSPPVEEKATVQVASSSPPANASAGKQRTPVESYRSTVSTDSSPKSGVPEPVVNDNEAAANDTQRSQLRSDQAGNTGSRQSNPEAATNDTPAETEPEQFHPGIPAPIGYWDLPDAVRSDVPEIKFSVLVYAAEPADRFVLINGQRLGEGDSASPGLVVKEIRREGVVFSYRLYQFLVER